MQYKLIINDNYEITEFESSDIQISYALKDVIEFDKRKTSFSKPINIPITQQTSGFFKSAFSINDTGSFDKNVKIKVEIFEDGISIICGSLYLENIYNDRYEVVVAKNDLNLFKDVGEKEMNKLNFDSVLYNHRLTKQHVYDNFHSPNSGGGINYMFLQNDSELKNVYEFNSDFTSYYPSTCAKELFEKILHENGYTYSISSDVNKYLEALYLPFNGGLEKFTTSYNFFKAHLGASYNNASYVDISDGYQKNSMYFYLEDEDYQLQGMPQKNTILSLSTKVSGIYQFDFTVKAKLDATDATKETVKFVIKYDNESFDLGEMEISSTSKTQTFKSKPFLIPEVKLPKLYVECEDRTKVQIYQADSYVTGYLQNYLFEGITDISMNDVLPVNYKQKQFIKDVLNVFNLYVYEDSLQDKHLHFETFEDYYEDEVIDWSKKLDSNSVKFTDLSYSLPNKFNFEFSENTDVYSKDFKTQFNKGYGSYSFENSDKNATNKEDKIKLNISSTPVVRMNDYVFFSNVYEKAGSTKFKPKMLFLNNFDLSHSTPYPLFTSDGDYTAKDYTRFQTGTEYYGDDYTSSELVLSFNNSKTYLTDEADDFSNNTLYNKYYRQDVESKINGGYKLLECKLLLNKYDVNINNFKKLIFINDEKIGSAYYRISEIKNYKNSSTFCDVVLIKINDYQASYNSTVISEQLKLTEISKADAVNNSYSGGGSSSSSSSVDLDKYYDKAETNTLLLDYYKEADAVSYIGVELLKKADKVHSHTDYIRKTGEVSQTIEGNLLVTGNIIAYADDGTTVGSIFDNLPISSTTSKGIAQFSSNQFTVENGIVSIKDGVLGGSGLDETQLSTYLHNNKYVNQSWVESQNYLTTHQSLSDYTKTADVWTKSNIPNLDKLTIDEYGNLLVTGNIIAYADDGTTVGSIFDNLPNSSTTSKGLSQFSDSYFTVNNGIVSIKDGVIGGGGLDETELASYLNTNKYVNQSWVTGQNYLTTHQDLSSYYNSSNANKSGVDWTARNLTIHGIASLYSSEVGKTDTRLTLNTNDADLIKIYALRESTSTKHSIVIGDSKQDNGLWINPTNTNLYWKGKIVYDANNSNKSDVDWIAQNLTASTVYANGSIMSSSAALQVNGFMRTGYIYIHTGGNTPDTVRTSDVLQNSGGTLQWRSYNVYHAGSANKSDKDWTTRFLTSHGLATLNHGLQAGLGGVKKFEVVNDGTTTTGNHTATTGFYIKDTKTSLTQGNASSLRVTTPSGYVDVGAMNGGFAHFLTGNPLFYFNKHVHAVGGFTVYGTNTSFTENTLNINQYTRISTVGRYLGLVSGGNEIQITGGATSMYVNYRTQDGLTAPSDWHWKAGKSGGTASDYASFTLNKLTTKGKITANCFWTNTTNINANLFSRTSNSTGTNVMYVQKVGDGAIASFRHGSINAGTGTEYFGITNNGTKTTGNHIATGNVTAYSDMRLKKYIKPFQNVLSNLSKLDTFYYERTDLESNELHIGVSAQQVQSLYPEFITVLDDERKTLTVDYGKLAASISISGLKEVKSEIDLLKEEVEVLKTEIVTLKKNQIMNE